jgi:hypothetical protein
MNAQDIKTFAERLMDEVWRPFNYEKLPEFYHHDVIGHHRSQTIRFEDIENRLKWDRKNVTKPVYTIRNLVTSENEFALRFDYTARAIQDESELAVEVIYFYHLRGGKIDEFRLLASMDFDYLEKA